MSFKEQLKRGLITILVLLIIYKLLAWLWFTFLDVIRFFKNAAVSRIGLEKFIFSEMAREWLGIFIILILLTLLAYFLGKVSISGIFVYIFKRRTGQTYLFCARIKNPNFFGGYPIGFATKVYKKNGRNYYNICFPNLGGFITIPDVPEEDMERVPKNIGEMILFYISCGAL